MADKAIIYFDGPDRPGLIKAVTNTLFDLGGNLSDLTFAALGEVGQMTIIYEMPKGLSTGALEKELGALPEMAEIKFRANEFNYRVTHGPTSRITHRIILSGGDEPGLVARVSEILDRHGANIVRLNSEKIEGKTGNQFISRFAVSLRDQRAPSCLADIVNLASEMQLTFRYETA